MMCCWILVFMWSFGTLLKAIPICTPPSTTRLSRPPSPDHKVELLLLLLLVLLNQERLGVLEGYPTYP